MFGVGAGGLSGVRVGGAGVSVGGVGVDVGEAGRASFSLVMVKPSFILPS